MLACKAWPRLVPRWEGDLKGEIQSTNVKEHTYVFGKYTSSASMPTCLALSSECTRLMPCLLPFELLASLRSALKVFSWMLPLSSWLE